MIKRLFTILVIAYLLFADLILIFMDATKFYQMFDAKAFLGIQIMFDFFVYFIFFMFLACLFVSVIYVIKNGFKVPVHFKKENVLNAIKRFFDFKKRPIKSALWTLQILIGLFMLLFVLSAITQNLILLISLIGK